MLQRFIHRVSLPLLHLQQIVDQVDSCKESKWMSWINTGWKSGLTIRRNFLPRIGRVHKSGILDLVVDVLVLIKRESAAQAYVDNHSHAPHVQGAIVAFVPQNLWS